MQRATSPPTLMMMCMTRPIMVMAPMDNTSSYAYDARGRKIAEWGTAIQSACFGYDGAGNRLAALRRRKACHHGAARQIRPQSPHLYNGNYFDDFVEYLVKCLKSALRILLRIIHPSDIYALSTVCTIHPKLSI